MLSSREIKNQFDVQIHSFFTDSFTSEDTFLQGFCCLMLVYILLQGLQDASSLVKSWCCMATWCCMGRVSHVSKKKGHWKWTIKALWWVSVLPRNAIASIFHWRILNQTHVVCSSWLQPLSGLTQYFDVHRTRPVPWLALVGHVGLLPSSFVGVALVSSHDPRAKAPQREKYWISRHKTQEDGPICPLSSF